MEQKVGLFRREPCVVVTVASEVSETKFCVCELSGKFLISLYTGFLIKQDQEHTPCTYILSTISIAPLDMYAYVCTHAHFCLLFNQILIV